MKTLLEIHEDVPADHYDKGLKHNLFQKFWHSRRFHEVSKVVKEVKGPFIDIGCHAGTFTEQILRKINSKKVYGVDLSPSAIALASKKIPHGKFKIADGAKLPFKSNFFEAAFCLEMLEHVDNPVEVLKEIKRVLKKGGYLVLLVPTDSYLFRFIWFVWTLYYPVWRHAHVQSFRSDSLEKLLKKLKFKKITIKKFNFGMLKLVTCML